MPEPLKVSPAFAGPVFGGPVLSALVLAAAATACAHPSFGYTESVGSWVGVTVCVEGEATPLLADPRGTGRFYLEAREGAHYEIRLENRTRERLGVAVAVDGLDVISGAPGGRRLYVLDPWGGTTIRGWRTSLHEVRRFVFVDEKASYAARSGQANGRMGWIEVRVYREASPWAGGIHPAPGRVDPPPPWDEEAPSATLPESRLERPGDDSPAPAPASPPPTGGLSDLDPALDKAPSESAGSPRARHPRPPIRFPGTGWGSRAEDRVRVVDFVAQPDPVERATLRYEYAATLRALGIRPWRDYARDRDRMRERERGEWGFAEPPR